MKLSDVFGVSQRLVASYIERDDVDNALSSALEDTRQIIIYGSSKQGKTTLINRLIPEDMRVTSHCTPPMDISSLYSGLLRNLGVEILQDTVSSVSTEINGTGGIKLKAKIPLFTEAEGTIGGGGKRVWLETSKSAPIDFRLDIAQDVGELILRSNPKNKFMVLENFHYLSEEVQKNLAFDLRTFEGMGVRFVILGVWRESNRLAQYCGDLQDRIAEVPIEPWDIGDFKRIAFNGEALLNIRFDQNLLNSLISAAHGSVGVVQELLKQVCLLHGVKETQDKSKDIDDLSLLIEAIKIKINEYSARHLRALESIAAGSRTRRMTDATVALFLPYYFVKIILNRNYEELKNGIERKYLEDLIKAVHPTPDHVRNTDVTGMLKRLKTLQAKLNISPPLFQFDEVSRRLKVLDSTLYFYIDHCDAQEIMSEIPHPDSQNEQDEE